MAKHEAPPSLHDLMAHVGLLLLRWGILEDEVRRAIRRLSGKADAVDADFVRWAHLQSEADPTTQPRVRAIVAALEPVRGIRNLVAHGMIGASADGSKHPEPTLRCVSREGETKHVTLSQIKRAIGEVDALRADVLAFDRHG